MSHNSRYQKDIDSFQRYGTYTYKFDEVGNVVFDSSSGDFSQVYLGLPLQDYLYDETKVIGFYDPTFTEFVPQTTQTFTEDEIQQMQFELEAQKVQSDELQKQLASLIEENESNPTEAERAATKKVILELRKSLGQGRVDSDFSTDFPYTSLVKPTSIADTPTETEAETTMPITTAVVSAEPTTPTLTTPDPEIFAAQASASARFQASASAAALSTALQKTLGTWVEEKRVDYRTPYQYRNRYYYNRYLF